MFPDFIIVAGVNYNLLLLPPKLKDEQFRHIFVLLLRGFERRLFRAGKLKEVEY